MLYEVITKLFFGDYQDVALQKRAANSFMLLPGGVQIRNNFV